MHWNPFFTPQRALKTAWLSDMCTRTHVAKKHSKASTGTYGARSPNSKAHSFALDRNVLGVVQGKMEPIKKTCQEMLPSNNFFPRILPSILSGEPKICRASEKRAGQVAKHLAFQAAHATGQKFPQRGNLPWSMLGIWKKCQSLSWADSKSCQARTIGKKFEIKF